jgi:hypothetical protein
MHGYVALMRTYFEVVEAYKKGDLLNNEEAKVFAYNLFTNYAAGEIGISHDEVNRKFHKADFNFNIV